MEESPSSNNGETDDENDVVESSVDEPEVVDWREETVYPIDSLSPDQFSTPLNEDPCSTPDPSEEDSIDDSDSYPPSDTIESPNTDSDDDSPIVTYSGDSWQSVYFPRVIPQTFPRPPSVTELNSWELSEESQDAEVPLSFELNWNFFNRFEEFFNKLLKKKIKINVYFFPRYRYKSYLFKESQG
jgi:hypothetical protein